MQIVTDTLSIAELQRMAESRYGDLVKAVVDISREILAVDAEMHSDLEFILLDDGSEQTDLWGINLYPGRTGSASVEFDSMINMRPSQGNRSRGVENASTRDAIRRIADKRIAR